MTPAARLRDILQLRFTPLFAGLPARTLNAISPANPARRLLKVLGYAAVRLVGNAFRPIHNPDPLRGATWLYVVSQNNVDALAFLTGPNGLSGAVPVAGQGKQIGRFNGTVNRLSLRRKILYYGQLPGVWWHLWRTEGRAAWRFFDLIFVAVGYYEVYRRALRHYQPRAVIFANDHNDDARALLLACRAESIPTAYVQHASVSRWFPPLAFDLSLLEGQHALDTYRACGPIGGEVALVGMPKADAFLNQRNTAPTVRRVAIAANLLDSTEGLRTAVTTLLTALPNLTFTFRAHPGDHRDFRALLTIPPDRLAFSDARTESVFAFLGRHDALVAADTSTHLEATLLNLAAFYYRFDGSPPNLPDTPADLLDDYYGYARHGVTTRANSLAELLAGLRTVSQHKPADLYRRAAYYCATLGTTAEGRSQEVARERLGHWLTVLL